MEGVTGIRSVLPKPFERSHDDGRFESEIDPWLSWTSQNAVWAARVFFLPKDHVLPLGVGQPQPLVGVLRQFPRWRHRAVRLESLVTICVVRDRIPSHDI